MPLDHPLVVVASAVAGAITVLGAVLLKFLPDLGKAIGEFRHAVKGPVSTQVAAATAQRDAMVEGVAYVLLEVDSLEDRAKTLHPECRLVLQDFAVRARRHLRITQERAGVQSDLAPIVDQAKAAVRGETPETGVKVPKEEA